MKVSLVSKRTNSIIPRATTYESRIFGYDHSGLSHEPEIKLRDRMWTNTAIGGAITTSYYE